MVSVALLTLKFEELEKSKQERSKGVSNMSAFASVLQSPSIRILVGDDRKEFTVHRKVLEKHLHNLTVPSRERYIEFDGDEESIGYLLEFLYTGDYTLTGASKAAAEEIHKPHQHVEEAPTPAPSPPIDGEEPIHPIILAARTSGLGVWGRPAALHHKFNHGKPAPKPQHKAPTAVITNGIASPPASPSLLSKEDPIANGSTAESPFLTHAKVYLLAERYGANSLKEHSLHKLRASLKAFELDHPADRTATLIKFIKSVYDLPASSNPGISAYGKETRNKLREAVVGHAVAYLPELQKDAEFNAYIRGGGDFVGDLFGVLAAGQHRKAHH